MLKITCSQRVWEVISDMDVHHAAYIDRFAPDIDIIDKKTANNQGCVKYITFNKMQLVWIRSWILNLQNYNRT